MNDHERELDLLVAELESDVRKMKAENDNLRATIHELTVQRDGIKKALERIHAISLMAFRSSGPEGNGQVGKEECTEGQHVK